MGGPKHGLLSVPKSSFPEMAGGALFRLEFPESLFLGSPRVCVKAAECALVGWAVELCKPCTGVCV